MSTGYERRKQEKELKKREERSRGRYVAYYRVSTEEQGISGLGLEAQRAVVTDFVKPPERIICDFTEIESGANPERPVLKEALEVAETHSAFLIVSRLDRLARDLGFLARLQRHTLFVACDMPHASSFELHIRAAIAEEERRLISERTKAALAAAKARGTVLGGYRGVTPQNDWSAFIHRFKHHLSVAKAEGLTLNSQIAAFLISEGVTTTPKGRPLDASAVARWRRKLGES